MLLSLYQDFPCDKYLSALGETRKTWAVNETILQPLALAWNFNTLTWKQGISNVKTRFLAFDLDIWPVTLTCNPSLPTVKVDPHTKNQGPRSNGSAVRALTSKQTNTQTDRRTLPSTLSSCFAKAPWSLIMKLHHLVFPIATSGGTEEPKVTYCHT